MRQHKATRAKNLLYGALYMISCFCHLIIVPSSFSLALDLLLLLSTLGQIDSNLTRIILQKPRYLKKYATGLVHTVADVNF